MIIRAPSCKQCDWDEQAISAWRTKGGLMPKRLCKEDHRPVCKKCRCRMYEMRKSGLCDWCWKKLVDTKTRKRKEAEKRKKK